MKNIKTFENFGNEKVDENLKSIIGGLLLLLSTQNMDARIGTISGGGSGHHTEYGILKSDALSEIINLDISGVDNKYELEQVKKELMKKDSDVNVEYCLKMLSDFCSKENGVTYSGLDEIINRTLAFPTNSLDSINFDDVQRNNLFSIIKDLRKMQSADRHSISQKFDDTTAAKHGILNLPQTFIFLVLLILLAIIARRIGFC